MKAHQKQRVVDLGHPPTHIGQDKRGGEGEDFLCFLNPHPPTPELLFARRRGKAIERRAQGKGGWEEFWGRLRQLLQPLFGITPIGEKALILGLGQR
jgi:hypothetical protein